MNHKKSKRKPKSKSGPPPRDGIRVEASAERGAMLPDSATVPSTITRSWVSIWLCVHLIALMISFTGVVEPSTLHARLSGLVHPYLRAAHFAADDRPVYLVHGTSSEQPHRLQITDDLLYDIDGVTNCTWRTVGEGDYDTQKSTPGFAVSDRVARWLSTAATLSEHDQPGVVADLLIPVAKYFPDATAMRIVRFPTDLNDVNVVEESPYVARLIRDGDQVSLIQLTPRRLSSEVVPASGGAE
jgi:hypothetical protein